VTGFPHLPVESLQGATQNFEHLESELQGLEARIGDATGWATLALGAKLEVDGAYQAPGVRREDPTVRFRGALLVKAGAKLEAGETLLTLTAHYRPPAREAIGCVAGGALAVMTIETSGVVIVSVAVAEAGAVYLGNLSFTLT
jgi:hypothetical protein